MKVIYLFISEERKKVLNFRNQLYLNSSFTQNYISLMYTDDIGVLKMAVKTI